MQFPIEQSPDAIEAPSAVCDGKAVSQYFANLDLERQMREEVLATIEPFELLRLEESKRDGPQPEGVVKRLSECKTNPPSLGATEALLPQNREPEGPLPLTTALKGDLPTGNPRFGKTGLMETPIYPGRDTAGGGATEILAVQVKQTIYKSFVKKEDKHFYCIYPDCDQANAAFKKRSNVERHIQTLHTGESRTICEACGHVFSREDNKRTHKCPQAATTTYRRKKRRQRYN